MLSGRILNSQSPFPALQENVWESTRTAVSLGLRPQILSHQPLPRRELAKNQRAQQLRLHLNPRTNPHVLSISQTGTQARRGTDICGPSHSLKAVAARWTQDCLEQSPFCFLRSRPPHIDWLVGVEGSSWKLLVQILGGHDDGGRIQKVPEVGRPVTSFLEWRLTEEVNPEVLLLPFNGAEPLSLRGWYLLRYQEKPVTEETPNLRIEAQRSVSLPKDLLLCLHQ